MVDIPTISQALRVAMHWRVIANTTRDIATRSRDGRDVREKQSVPHRAQFTRGFIRASSAAVVNWIMTGGGGEGFKNKGACLSQSVRAAKHIWANPDNISVQTADTKDMNSPSLLLLVLGWDRL